MEPNVDQPQQRVELVVLLNKLRDVVEAFESDPNDTDALATVPYLREAALQLREGQVFRERWLALTANRETLGQSIGWCERELKAIWASGPMADSELLNPFATGLVDPRLNVTSDVSPAVRAAALHARVRYAQEGVLEATAMLARELAKEQGLEHVPDQRRAQLQVLNDWERERDEAQRLLDALQPPAPNAVATGVPDALATILASAPLLP